MYGLYCEAINLKGFVIGEYTFQGEQFLSTEFVGGYNTRRIKVYQSKKRAETMAKKLKDKFWLEIEVKEFTEEELRTIEESKK
ncbi:hypothetical protein I6N96_12585 [Enterococcus sp. BWM-S5]|uniref:Phage protein n=1 Tax=Enterococcus larvae TaxID=2794352 RepID=A0ABS4CM36_9ENTE|nr:hypothetical protein [Enterococcus larvae]MBP1047110.1 hypothetical protein [Enterococcus larvae]